MIARGPAAGAHRRRAVWWGTLGLVALVAAAHGQTLWFDLVKDDHWLIASRVSFHDVITAPHLAYRNLAQTGAVPDYRPALAASVALDGAMWGQRPTGFHLSNIVAHLSAVLLLWRLAWWMTGNTWAAVAAGALLAVHPSAVEAVTGVWARVDLFVGLGMVASLLLLRGSAWPGGTLRLVGALFCFAFALGSKETALVTPAMLTWAAWVYPAWFGGSAPAPRPPALAGRLAPFWLLLVPYGMLRRAVLGKLTAIPLHLTDVPMQLLRALVAVGTYVEMTLIPSPRTGFIVSGKIPPPVGVLDGRVLIGLGAVALLVAAPLWLRRRNPPAAMALGAYAGALVPTSNILPIHWVQDVYVAERSLYPALVFWCLFVAVAACTLVGAGEDRLQSWALMKVLAGGALATLLIVTVGKGRAWRNDVTLWTTAVAAHPDSVEVRLNLVVALAQAGDVQAADATFREAATFLPEDPNIAYMAGWLAQLRGESHEALRQYERAIDLGTDLWRAYRDAALLAAQHQAWDRAGHWFAAAAERFPQAAWPQVGLGWYRQRQGRADLARAHFERAARLEPKSPERARLLGQLLAAEGRGSEAIEAFRAARALDSSYVPANRELAFLLEREGRTAEAIGLWQQIAESVPASHRGEALERIRQLQAAAGGSPGGQDRGGGLPAPPPGERRENLGWPR